MNPIKVETIVKVSGGILLQGKKELAVEEISIDSRTKTVKGLFVPITGERSDGHDFITDAIRNGAVAVFVASGYTKKRELLRTTATKKIALIEVEDTLVALQTLAAWYREQFPVPVVGITGSVGKTTTKEMVAAALEAKLHVLKTIGNKNSQIGLALMMFYLDYSYDIAVIEMGMSEFGEMGRLADIAKPECAVITNIGVAHIAQLKTQENIRKEKLSIVQHFVTGSSLFLNGNDKLLREAATQITQNMITMDCNNTVYAALKQTVPVTYGILSEKKDAVRQEFDFAAKEIQTTKHGISFVAVYKEENETKELPVQLKVYGEHNVLNALAALAVAMRYGVSPDAAADGLAKYQPIEKRGQIKTKHGITWIDDTYNASPDSMKSSVQVLLSLETSGRRIAVFADVLELGEQSEQLHREVGSYVAELEKNGERPDLLITVGEQARFIAEEALRKREMKVVSFETNSQVIEFLHEELKSGDTVLVKGSRGMKTDEIVAAFLS